MNGPQNNDLKRQFLMKRLLDAVKQCQIRFGGRKEIASDSDSRVICLCAQFEAVLQHGLKRSRGLTLTAAAIKQAAGFASKTETDPMFWVYVKEILNKHELQRFYSLKTITTDIGRGRAWLRCALNEHSLERYLHMLLGDTNRLSFFYEDWSFLFDEERSSMLPTMAAGLNSILFAINIDNADLNGPAKTVPTVSHLLKESTQNVTSLLKESTQGVSNLLRDITSSSAVSILIKPEQESDPLPVLSKSLTTDGKAKKERKKKKKVLTIISFDDDGDMEDPDLVNVSKTLMSSIESSEKQTDSSSEVLPHFEAQFQLDLHDKENDDSSCVTEEVDYAKLVVKSIAKEELDDYDAYEPEIVSWSGDRDKSASCEQTPVGSSEHPQVCCWTPLQVLHDNSEVLFPVKAAGSYSHSDSTLDNLPHGHENESATFAKELAQRETDIHFSMEASPPVPGPTLTSILLGIPEPDSMIFRELRQASVILKNRKDELEEQNISLRNLLDSEMEHSSILRLEIDNLRRKVEEQEERHAAKIQALARENEVLKVQLKKYVCAVQMLKKEGHNDTIPNPRNIDGEIIPEVKPVVDHGELASSYEQKLIEVAEMHGELIEFNERLHRTLLTKEALVLQMRQELIDLRGPVPGDLSQTSEDESLSDFEISHRALVNVWIPSVFLRGKSTHAFHVYQIYIRIKDDEWNIYKRYAEFRSLHHKLLSKYPHVKTFYFPPKKAIGNKDAKFVEERRKQLQVYLRNVMNKVIQTMPDFVAKPNKDRLTDIIPFFASE
ncbi:sorting nexin-29 isoform X2 [Aquarana catesbeiana]|uniref:sorting nexin-29 isoform X2 n=1 Tax=Aquarana catesbeiana TaxID=8400 RepID=UPI003CC9B004